MRIFRLMLVLFIYTWGTPKFPELLKINYLKCLYKFETLVLFEILPLRVDAAIPAPLPMLETLSKIFKRNAVKGRQRLSSNLYNVSKLPALQILLHPWEPNKSQGAWSRKWLGGGGGGGGGHNRYFVFSQNEGALYFV